MCAEVQSEDIYRQQTLRRVRAIEADDFHRANGLLQMMRSRYRSLQANARRSTRCFLTPHFGENGNSVWKFLIKGPFYFILLFLLCWGPSTLDDFFAQHCWEAFLHLKYSSVDNVNTLPIDIGESCGKIVRAASSQHCRPIVDGDEPIRRQIQITWLLEVEDQHVTVQSGGHQQVVEPVPDHK